MTSTIDSSLAAPHEKLHAIQAGRAVAAIMVVAYHANDIVLPLRLYDGRIAWRGFGMGYVGERPLLARQVHGYAPACG